MNRWNEYDENILTTYADQKYTHHNIIEYQIDELWNEYSYQIILIKLYYKSCTYAELSDYFQEMMMNYFNTMAREQKTSLSEIFGRYFHPYVENQDALLKIIRELISLQMIISQSQNMYSIEEQFGKEQMERLLSNKHKEYYLFFKMFRQNAFNSINRLKIAMKWIETKFNNQLDPILYMIISNETPMSFEKIISFYSEYLYSIEQKDLQKIDPNSINEEIYRRLYKLLSQNLITGYSQNNEKESENFDPIVSSEYLSCTKKGYEVIKNVNNELAYIFQSLENDNLMIINENDVELTNTGKTIALKIISDYETDLERLSKRPDVDSNKIGGHAPIHNEFQYKSEMQYYSDCVNMEYDFDIPDWQKVCYNLANNPKFILSITGIGMSGLILSLILFFINSPYTIIIGMFGCSFLGFYLIISSFKKHIQTQNLMKKYLKRFSKH